MPDQAAALAIVDSPPTRAERSPGPALDTDAGARVIPLDTRRRRPSPAVVAACRAEHPSQMWAERMQGSKVAATPS